MGKCRFPITVDRGYRAHFRALNKWIAAGQPDYRKPTRFIAVRCGHCDECLKAKRREWLLRLHYHLRVQEHPSYFVTLTYETEPREGVCKKDVQDFMKRLRHTTKEKISYFLCSEYGEKHQRAHYHMILFNYNGDTEQIAESWRHGFIKVGDVTDASINYVAKYFITKQCHPEGKNENFSLISKGIGKSLVTPEIEEFLQNGNLLKIGQQKYATPRYVKDKMDINEFEIEYIPTELNKEIDNMLEKYGGNPHLAIDAYNEHCRYTTNKLRKRKTNNL